MYCIYSIYSCIVVVKYKDIMLKTTQPFFKSSYELHLTLWGTFLEIRFEAAFQWRIHRNIGWRPLPELPLGQRYIMLKTTQPFLKSYCESHLTLWNFFLDVRIKAAFPLRNHRIAGWHPLPELPLWQRYHTNNYFTSSYQLHLTLWWRIYLKVKIPLPENFLSYLLQVSTCTSVQFDINR